jgi:hypothetical protein
LLALADERSGDARARVPFHLIPSLFMSLSESLLKNETLTHYFCFCAFIVRRAVPFGRLAMEGRWVGAKKC